jgi:hypothetical protein
MGMGAADSVATFSIGGGSLVGDTKTGMPCRGVKSTPYAQLFPPSPTALFTTYCGSGEGQIQILGAQPGMSTRNRHLFDTFFAATKISRQIKVFSEQDA